MSSGLDRIDNFECFRLQGAPMQFGLGSWTQFINSFLFAFTFAFTFAFVTICLVGCSAEKDHDHAHIVYHHRPADFKTAVLRLDEMHQILTGPESLPPAKTFSGSSNSHDDENQNGLTKSDEVISVGIFQEYFDIVRWLPTIAADSDLPKSEWDTINESSKKLSQLVKEIESDPTLPDTKNQSADDRMRALYRERTKPFETAISELHTKLGAYDEWQSKVVN